MRDWLENKLLGFRTKVLGRPPRLERFAADLRETNVPDGVMGQLFAEHDGRVIDKWLHYLPAYETYFSKFRDTDVRVIEIGVFKGGSLELWRKYFGKRAKIVGIDIDPTCASYVQSPNSFILGSQDDRAVISQALAEVGPPDIVIDDGSHFAHHQRASFRLLWPSVKAGGYYLIEDTHTAYFPGIWRGGYQRPGTAIELAKRAIDDMHHWYHRRPTSIIPQRDLRALHVYDSMLFFEKGVESAPVRTSAGRSV